jgi:uncharacterized membrane protein YfhO
VRIVPGADGTFAPNYLQYEVKGTKSNLVVFSEVHYPIGWNAYVDGKQVPYIRANYVLRALAVPAGVHKVEFKFEPEAYHRGEQMAMAGSVAVLLLFAGATFITLRKKEG